MNEDQKQTTAPGVESNAGLDFLKKLREGKWILWRWKKSGNSYSESRIQEKRGNLIALTGYRFWTNYPNWVDVNEIDISWVGRKKI
uniref:Uncharacterized protein n=1 Tax=viral metagenome TaxID=1070528 RepID=A0A6H2A558_9ZZZZ